jgi:hypothetical protein
LRRLATSLLKSNFVSNFGQSEQIQAYRASHRQIGDEKTPCRAEELTLSAW